MPAEKPIAGFTLNCTPWTAPHTLVLCTFLLSSIKHHIQSSQKQDPKLNPMTDCSDTKGARTKSSTVWLLHSHCNGSTLPSDCTVYWQKQLNEPMHFLNHSMCASKVSFLVKERKRNVVPNSKTEYTQGLLPHKRWQNPKVLLGFTFPKQSICTPRLEIAAYLVQNKCTAKNFRPPLTFGMNSKMNTSLPHKRVQSTKLLLSLTFPGHTIICRTNTRTTCFHS